MQSAIRWLCVSLLMLGTLACGSEPEKPCSSVDKAAGRCQKATVAAPAALPPGTFITDSNPRLCDYWQRPDGSCDQTQLLADYTECLNTMGIPERDRLIAQGVGSRNVQRARDRATYLCLELRKWFMTQAGRDLWLGS